MRLHFEDGERELLVARLGLDENADDAAVAQAVGEWMAEDTDTSSDDSSTDDSGSSTENIDMEAAGDDVILVDVAEFNRLRHRDRLAGEVEETMRRRDRDDLIAEAVHDGKISPSRRDHYRTRYDSDPDGTRTLLGQLTPNTVPLEARGADVPTDEVDETSYPKDWVPEVAARAAKAQSGSRVHGEAD